MINYAIRPLVGTTFDSTEPCPDFTGRLHALLAEFGYLDRFGVCLLHRHWNEPGEILVERPVQSGEARLTSIGPADIDLLAVQWRVTANGLEVTQACGLHKPVD